jgi:DNA-binding NarL/FixJ family response regulator
VYQTVLERLFSSDFDWDDSGYFSFTVGIRRHPQLDDSDYLMVDLKITPATTSGSTQTVFCTMASSAIKTSGHLGYYSGHRQVFEEYSFKCKKWEKIVIEKLTPCETAILKRAKQGKSNKEIDIPNIGVGTLKNIKTELYKKLHVKTIRQAIIFVATHRLRFVTAGHSERDVSAYLSIEKDDNRYSMERLIFIVTESVCVIDFATQRFRFVADHDLFLCGHSIDEAMESDYDFLRRITHPDDLSLIYDVRKIISQRLSSPDDDLDDLDYFSFMFRIRNHPQLTESDYLMVYCKITPATTTGSTQTVLCVMTSAVNKTSGSLRAYYKHRPEYEEYSCQSKKWEKPERDKFEKLTPREASVVKHIEQGKSVNEIAKAHGVAYSTVQTQIEKLLLKLDVHSMEDAMTYASGHRLVFVPTEEKPQSKKEAKTIPIQNKAYHSTPASLAYIQERLNNGCSVNSIAKTLNCTEGTIRYGTLSNVENYPNPKKNSS